MAYVPPSIPQPAPYQSYGAQQRPYQPQPQYQYQPAGGPPVAMTPSPYYAPPPPQPQQSYGGHGYGHHMPPLQYPSQPQPPQQWQPQVQPQAGYQSHAPAPSPQPLPPTSPVVVTTSPAGHGNPISVVDHNHAIVPTPKLICGIISLQAAANYWGVFAFFTIRVANAIFAGINYNQLISGDTTERDHFPQTEHWQRQLLLYYPLAAAAPVLGFVMQCYVIYHLRSSSPRSSLLQLSSMANNLRNQLAVIMIHKHGRLAFIRVLADIFEVVFSIWMFQLSSYRPWYLVIKLLLSCYTGIMLLPELYVLVNHRKWLSRGVKIDSSVIVDAAVQRFDWNRKTDLMDLLETHMAGGDISSPLHRHVIPHGIPVTNSAVAPPSSSPHAPLLPPSSQSS